MENDSSLSWPGPIVEVQSFPFLRFGVVFICTPGTPSRLPWWIVTLYDGAGVRGGWGGRDVGTPVGVLEVRTNNSCPRGIDLIHVPQPFTVTNLSAPQSETDSDRVS